MIRPRCRWTTERYAARIQLSAALRRSLTNMRWVGTGIKDQNCYHANTARMHKRGVTVAIFALLLLRCARSFFTIEFAFRADHVVPCALVVTFTDNGFRSSQVKGSMSLPQRKIKTANTRNELLVHYYDKDRLADASEMQLVTRCIRHHSSAMNAWHFTALGDRVGCTRTAPGDKVSRGQWVMFCGVALNKGNVQQQISRRWGDPTRRKRSTTWRNSLSSTPTVYLPSVCWTISLPCNVSDTVREWGNSHITSTCWFLV